MAELVDSYLDLAESSREFGHKCFSITSLRHSYNVVCPLVMLLETSFLRGSVIAFIAFKSLYAVMHRVDKLFEGSFLIGILIALITLKFVYPFLHSFYMVFEI